MKKTFKSRISLVGGLVSAVAFIPRGVLAALLPYAIILAINAGLVVLQERRTPLESLGPLSLLGLVAIILAFVMVYGALYRAAVGKPSQGFLGLQWTRVEWRLIGSALCIILLVMLVMIPLSIVILIAIKVAGGHPVLAETQARHWQMQPLSLLNVHPTAQLLPTLIGAGVLWVVAIYLRARLALFAAASVGEGRVSMTDSWTLTRGAVLKMIVGLFIVQAPTWSWQIGEHFYDLDVGSLSRWSGLALDPRVTTTMVRLLCEVVLGGVLSAGFLGRVYLDAGGRRWAAASEPEPAPLPEPQPA